MRRLSKNQKGFSLVGTLMAAAVVSIVSLGAASTFDNMSRAQNYQQFRNEADLLTEEIRALLSSSPLCRATLSSVRLNPGASSGLSMITDESGSARLSLNMIYGNRSLMVTQLLFSYSPGDAAAPAPANSGQGTLTVTLSASKAVLGPGQLVRTINIRTMKNPADASVADCVALAKSSDGLWQRSANLRDIFRVEGNVGIGRTDPKAKLDVDGAIKVGNTAVACDGEAEGQLRYNSTSKSMEFCNGEVWSSFNEDAPGTWCGIPCKGHGSDCPAGYTYTELHENVTDDGTGYRVLARICVKD